MGKVKDKHPITHGSALLEFPCTQAPPPLFLRWDGSGLGPKVYLDDHVLGPLCEVPLLLHLLILVLW